MALSVLPGKSSSLRSMTQAVTLIALLSAFSACGGGSSATAPLSSSPTPTNPSPPNPAPAGPDPVTGVAIPSNVSVVTATNAN